MEIKTVSIIGLGALGVLFGKQLADRMEPGQLRIVADADRIKRYQEEKVYCNGEVCEFSYIDSEQSCEPADLVLVCVKYGALETGIESLKNQVGENTVILSTLNGISSEEVLKKAFGEDKILYSVAQGMDAVKVGNRLTYSCKGIICFGEKEPGVISKKAKRVADFFDKVKFPYELSTNMYERMWGKFMLNVGVNQTVAIYEGDYGVVQKEGEARDTMIAAMREVMQLAPHEGVSITEKDLIYWLDILGTLGKEGKPSMRQDLEAGRKSEVELFSGTVLRLGEIHRVDTPVNQMLYDRIQYLEQGRH